MKSIFITFLRGSKCTLIRWHSHIRAMVYRCRGMEVGRNCVFTGRILIRRKRFCKTRIVLEDRVTINSDATVNRLMHWPSSLNCTQSNAEIILRKGCGMSAATLICSTRIEVGEYTMLGAGCTLYDCKQHEYHQEDGWTRAPQTNEGAPIIIGKRCFLGMNCTVLKGVTIGDNCVVSAGTIITRDMPAGHIAMGNPAVYYPLSERLRTTPEGVIPLPEA